MHSSAASKEKSVNYITESSFDVVGVKSKSGFSAGVTNVIKANISNILGAAPQVGGTLSRGVTVYDSLKAFCEGLSSTTYVSNLQASYSINKVSQYIISFVKTAGSLDSKQITCYAGNTTSIATTMVIPKIIYGSQNITAYNKVTTNNSTITSPYYNNGRWNIALKYYYNYTHNIQNGDYHYNIWSTTMTLLDGSTVTVRFPAPAYGF